MKFVRFFIPLGKSWVFSLSLPSAARPFQKPSSILMYLYPALASPVETMAFAWRLIRLSLMFSPKVFHELQPMVGGRS